ncbi:LamG domain-containing protein [Nocardioidaceae bacterium SCSIO 66511]|nr:LamG domain-containing protein [Nocardioidaceae bacterium SCSIO 66511]
MSNRPRLARLRIAAVVTAGALAATMLATPAQSRTQPSPGDAVASVAVFGSDRADAYIELLEDMEVDTSRFSVDELASADLASFDALVVTAPAYPEPTRLSADASSAVEEFVADGGSAYVEFATSESDLFPTTGTTPSPARFERIVAAEPDPVTESASDLAVFEEHQSYRLPAAAPDGAQVPLVYAKVAGVYDAVFGLPDEVEPALLRVPVGDGTLLYATTALSNYERGNYGLRTAWQQLNRDLLLSLLPKPAQDQVRANEAPIRAWTTPREWANLRQPVRLVVESAPNTEVIAQLGGRRVRLHETAAGRYRSGAMRLPEGRHTFRITAGSGDWTRTDTVGLTLKPRRQMYRRMVDRTMDWYDRAGMLYYRRNGEAGAAEGLVSELRPDGTHRFRERTRGDSFVQSAYAFRLYGELTGQGRYAQTAETLSDLALDRMLLKENNYLYGSWSTRGYDTKEHGDLGWLYPDDQGWLSLMSLVRFGQDGDQAALRDGLRGTEALRRTANAETGLYPVKRPSAADLLERGWQGTAAIPDQDDIALDPHWQSQPQTAMIYAYAETGEQKYLDAATKGLDRMIAEFPEVGIETSRTSALGRYLLPLAGAYTYTEQPHYLRAMLDIAKYIEKHQDAETGAIPELDGHNPASNEAYGTGENSIFQENGDPVTDQLYSLGLLSMNLQVSYEATDRPVFRRIQERLLDYLARIQIESPDESLDGTWMRAFDYKNWEYYGSSADTGWGPYAVQVGWTNAPIAISTLLYLSGDRFFPKKPTDRQDVSDEVSAEFDAIEDGAAPARKRDTARHADSSEREEASLVGSWSLDEADGYRVRDSSGRGNDGVLIGGDRVAGQNGGGVANDGDDYVYLTNLLGKDLDGAPGVTIGAWVKPAAVTDGTQSLFASRITNRRPGIDLTLKGDGSTSKLVVGARSDYPGGAVGRTFDATGLAPGEWHHVAVTIDFTESEIRAYVDGNQQAAESETGTSFPSDRYHWGNPAVPDTFGRTPNGGQYFVGSLDELRLLRTALAPGAVARLMRSTAGN